MWLVVRCRLEREAQEQPGEAEPSVTPSAAHAVTLHPELAADETFARGKPREGDCET